MTKQKKGRWKLKTIADALQVKGIPPTRQSTRDQGSKARDTEGGDGGEFGRGQNNILTQFSAEAAFVHL